MNGVAQAARVDIAVVGGGPAGLFTGVTLHKALPHARIKVYEKAKQYRECGAGILLDVNGMKALKAADTRLFTQFQQEVTDVSVQQAGPAMQATIAKWLSYKEKFGFRIGLIGWYELVKLLRDALPEGVLEVDHSLTHAQLSKDGHSAVLQFADGEAVQAKLLVAADGYFSAVRQSIVQDGPPEFADVVMWRARVQWREGMGLPEAAPGTTTGMRGDGMTSMLYTLPNRMVVWTFTGSADRVRAAGIEYDPERYTTPQAASKASSVQHTRSDDSSAYERCRQVVRAGLPQLESIVADTDPSAVVEHGMFTRPGDKVAALADQGWGKGVMTMVGDAAHSMRPTGQGVNTALEDAVVLASHLQRGGLNAGSLRSFERERIPRVSTIAQQEYAGAAGNYGTKIQPPLSPAEYEDFKTLWNPPAL